MSASHAQSDAADREAVEMELGPLPPTSGDGRTGEPSHVRSNNSNRGLVPGDAIEREDFRRRVSSVHKQGHASLMMLDKKLSRESRDEGVFVEEDDADYKRSSLDAPLRQVNELHGSSGARRTSIYERQPSRMRAPSTHSKSPAPSIYDPTYSGPPTTLPSAHASVDALAAPQIEHAFPAFQARPPEIKSAFSEIMFILVCSTGQLLFGVLTGGIAGLQILLTDMLQIKVSQTPWLVGSFLLANGLSVIVSGPLADLLPPKYLMCGAFAWQALANIIGVFSLHNKYLFFFMRAMQGLSVGVLVSSSVSILGRVYKPGQRKTRVFAVMSAMAPLGFWLGTMQGGALAGNIRWIFASDAMISALCTAMGMYSIPDVRPAQEGLTFRRYDYAGSLLAVAGCALLVAGLTQGPAANWVWYMILIVLLGAALLVAFFFVERRVARPLVPPSLWKIPGFTPMMIAYFLGFGSFLAWQFYAMTFWLRVQGVSPLYVGLYQTPNAVFGILATFIVARIAHLVDGHWILATSMLAFALGPVFFLPQHAGTTYWALSMPGVSLATFGPDLSFAATSIFITSSVSRHYQGSAGSLLLTVQNLSAAIMTSLTDTIGQRVSPTHGDEQISLKALHAMWWFDFSAAMAAALIVLFAVRIPRATEKEHVQ